MSIILSLALLFSRLSASAIWIACMSFFWIAILCDLDGQPYNYMAGVVLCLITFAVYAYDHVSGSQEDLLNNPHRAYLANWPIKPLAAIAYLLAVVLVCLWDSSRLFAVLAPGIAGYLYTSRIAGYRPKDLPGCKTLIVAASTSICRAGLIHAGIEIYLFVFIAMVIDTVLCDCRDVCGDAASGVRTLPVLLGPSRTIALLFAFDLLLFALSPLVAAVGCLLIVYFRKNRNVLAYDLLVDGWMMWSYIAILLFKFS